MIYHPVKRVRHALSEVKNKAISLGRFMLSCARPRSIVKAFKTCINDGPRAVLKKIQLRRRSFHVERTFAYRDFQKATRLKEEDLDAQRRKTFKYRPVFGVVVPLFNTKTAYLEDLIDGFKNQTYANFKIFLVDASPVKHGDTALTSIVQQLIAGDARFIYHIIGTNKGIADNTNKGIRLAMADKNITHVGLCDHDDIIAPNAFFEYAKALNANRNIKILYSDEDKGINKKDPEAYYVAKPDFNEFLLESCNYINHFFVVDKDLLRKVKTKDGRYERPEFDGAQDYDLYLRLVTEALKLDKKLRKTESQKVKNCLYTSSTICHVPKFLYRWRAAEGSTAQNGKNKLYAFESGKRALETYYNARQIPIKSVELTEALGTYRTFYRPDKQPLVSVLIPNKDHVSDLNQAITSLQSGTYQNLEFIIVENNSSDPSTFAYYNKIQQQNKNIKVVTYSGKFNYSAINNFGAKYTRGDYILCLNNDVEMIDKDSIFEMVSILNRESVGIVGAQLLYPDNTIQHVGVIVGMGGSAGHVFVRQKLDTTYDNRARCTMNYSAVTGACLMIKKSVFNKAGGFDERLPIAFNDIDLCLSVRSLGFTIVYAAQAKFYHYESKSRGLDEDSPEKLKRLMREAKYLNNKWPALTKSGDPYFNPNLSLWDGDCSIRRIKKNSSQQKQSL